MKKYFLLLALMTLGFLIPASAQTTVFDCPSFTPTGTCGAGTGGVDWQNFVLNSYAVLKGSSVDILPAGLTHDVAGLAYHDTVNVQQFTSTFTFVPNGQFLAFVVQNTNNVPGFEGNLFVSGAGCEGGFYQAFGLSPNNLFAMELDAYSPLTESGQFTYSSTQIYHSYQSPCLPNDNGPGYYPTDKISTSPVPLDSPSDTPFTTTGDTYSATVTYTGITFTLEMYDVTAGGSCPGTKCFTHSWIVDIPALVGSNQAYVGFTGSSGGTTSYPLVVKSFSYTEGLTTSPINAANPPTFSPGPGDFTGEQSVKISDVTSGSTIYYTTNGETPSTSATRYTTPVAVKTTETLKAVAVASGHSGSAVASAAYTMAPTSAEPINFPSGFASQPGQLWLKSGVEYSGSAIELTNGQLNLANNVYYKTPVNVQSFITTFTWTASCPAKPAVCGDGLGFIIIDTSNPSSAGYNYSGTPGSQFSWATCHSSSNQIVCPAIKSVLVKFDLYNNVTNLPGADLTGFYSGGESPQSPAAEYNMAPAGIDIQSGHLMQGYLSYNGSLLYEVVTDTVTGKSYRVSYSVNIPALVGGNTAYVGFGASTGGASVTQKLESWTYTVE